MTPADGNELRALRERAYGRHSDIHLDPESLARLHALENAQVEVESVTDADADENIELAAEHHEPDDVAGAEDDESPRAARRTPRWVPWLLGLRRSTVVIALGVLLIVAALATALAMVQRVQTDPLQTGATQIARLGVDDRYEPPEIFFDSRGASRAYQQFHGLRVMTSPTNLWFGTSSEGTCLYVYPEESDSASDNSFALLFNGCGAGEFPPIVQFSVDIPGLPESLGSAFPESAGLQFVYDAENDEVVVFADRP